MSNEIILKGMHGTLLAERSDVARTKSDLVDSVAIGGVHFCLLLALEHSSIDK